MRNVEEKGHSVVWHHGVQAHGAIVPRGLFLEVLFKAHPQSM